MEFLPLIAIALVFWLLIIRPASKRQKEIVRVQSSIEVGDRVLLSSGIYATVTETLDSRIRAEIAPGVVVELARGAIAAVEPRDEEDPSTLDDQGPDALGTPET